MTSKFPPSLGGNPECNFCPMASSPDGLISRGGMSCQIKFAVANFAAGNFAESPGFCVVNFADTPRNVVVCGALQGRWSVATGANFAEGFCVGNFAANLRREIYNTKLTAPEIPPPPLRWCGSTLWRWVMFLPNGPCYAVESGVANAGAPARLCAPPVRMRVPVRATHNPAWHPLGRAHSHMSGHVTNDCLCPGSSGCIISH